MKSVIFQGGIWRINLWPPSWYLEKSSRKIPVPVFGKIQTSNCMFHITNNSKDKKDKKDKKSEIK